MLIKGNDIIDRKVLSYFDGKKISTIRDLIYDPDQNRVVAFLISSGNWFTKTRVIPFEEVRNIGQNAILVDSVKAIKEIQADNSRIAQMAKDNKYLTKTKIVTENGDELGRVSDIYFDDKSGQVKEFEVSSSGGITDFKTSKKRVPVENIITLGSDATIVRVKPEEGNESLSQQQDSIAEKTHSNMPQAFTDNKPDENLDQSAQKIAEGMRQKSVQEEMNQSYTIDPNLTPPTKFINADEPAEVDTSVKEDENLPERNIYQTSKDQEFETLRQDLSKIMDQTNQKLDRLTSETRSDLENVSKNYPTQEKPLDDFESQTLVNKSQEDLGRYQEVAYSQVTRPKTAKFDARKKEVVGMYVTKTILTLDDKVLAKRGDLITHKLVTKAEEEDVLDQVLDHNSFEPV